jgi:hypothetical protein
MSSDSAETVEVRVKIITADAKDIQFVLIYLACGLRVRRIMARSSWAVVVAALWEGESHAL